MPQDPDRRRLIIGAGVAIASGALGLGAAMTRWLRSDDDGVDAAASSTSSSSSSTAATSAAEPSSTTTSTAAPSTTQPATTTQATTRRPTGSNGLEVLCRDAWGAAPPRGTLPRHTIDELTVHHTAAVLTDNRKVPARIRGFQQGHLDDGFVDLAYHYVIDAHGNVYQARSTDIPGETYTDYDPTGHFLAVCDGNFEEQPIPAAQLDGLAKLLAWASHHFGVPTSHLTGHRDEAATLCPGKHLYATLQDGSLKAAIDRYVAAGPPEMVVLCGAEGTARVAAITAGRD